MSRVLGVTTAALAAFALAACAATEASPTGAQAGAGGATASSSDTTGGAGGDGGAGFGVGGGQGTGGGAPVDGEVFAHSGDTLFKLNPVTKKVTVVGPFAGCNYSILDIAIDKDGIMFGTTFTELYRIDKDTARCALIAGGSFPNSLSFVPRGTVDPNAEALVGYEGANYVQIDTATGAKRAIGALGGGYVSSGDIVSVIGGGTYLTVKGGGCGDCIVEVDPTSGALRRSIGALGHADVFGLAFWGGAAYGFSQSGALFQVDLTTAATTDIPLPSAPAGLSFYGAGSTTSAPLVTPN